MDILPTAVKSKARFAEEATEKEGSKTDPAKKAARNSRGGGIDAGEDERVEPLAVETPSALKRRRQCRLKAK